MRSRRWQSGGRLTIIGCLRVTMATGTMIGTGIAPTLITVASLFLPTASGGDFTHGITILTTVTARITTAIPTATMTIRTTVPTLTPRTHIATTMATLPQLKVATALSAPSSRSWRNVDITAARSTECSVTKDRKSKRLNSSHDQISYSVFCL